MCSILAILGAHGDPTAERSRALRLSRLQRHRGPDWSGIHVSDGAVLAHERLAIVDLAHGAQPLRDPAARLTLAVNGEIYNHRELRASLSAPHPFLTDSDCEVILPLYRERGAGFLDALNGIFAFVLHDEEQGRYLIARDHLGIVPLYTGRGPEGALYVASEMKALVPVCDSVAEFPPGHVLDSEVGEPVRYYAPAWRGYDQAEGASLEPAALRTAVEDAVRRQLMSDVPYGVLLSGGLDSSVIAASVARFAERRVENGGRSAAWWPRVHSFAIGLADAPDLAAARRVAEHLGTVHHEFHFTVQEGLDALHDVVHHLETYDVTTIRAGTPMYLLARRVRAMGIKMVLSGEGADEVFGGYLYFHRAPDPRSFHDETVRKLDRLHSYDCLRANKAMAAWGVEARVPFLDRELLDLTMGIDPALKMPGHGRIEKHILREAFADALPESIVWRQKEQFSDGVGYSWIDSLKAHAEEVVSDTEMAAAADRFPHNTPTTREGYLYRSIFAEHFPLSSCAECVPGGASVACSTSEALEWDALLGSETDPSGRAMHGVHSDSW